MARLRGKDEAICKLGTQLEEIYQGYQECFKPKVCRVDADGEVLYDDVKG